MECKVRCLWIKYNVVRTNFLNAMEPLPCCKLIRVVPYIFLQKVKEACQSMPGRTWNGEERLACSFVSTVCLNFFLQIC
jgi:hypothetical protein